MPPTEIPTTEIPEAFPQAAPEAPPFEPAPGAAADPAYQVGPNRPPLQHRFAKGRSGNPHGRPRRTPRPAPAASRAHSGLAAPASALEKAVSRRVEIELNGRRRRLGLTQAVVARLIEKGLEGGDLVALRELLRVCADAEAARTARQARADAEAQAASWMPFRWTGRLLGPEDEDEVAAGDETGDAGQLLRVFGEMLDAEAEAAREGLGEEEE